MAHSEMDVCSEDFKFLDLGRYSTFQCPDQDAYQYFNADTLFHVAVSVSAYFVLTLNSAYIISLSFT